MTLTGCVDDKTREVLGSRNVRKEGSSLLVLLLGLALGSPRMALSELARFSKRAEPNLLKITALYEVFLNNIPFQSSVHPQPIIKGEMTI